MTVQTQGSIAPASVVARLRAATRAEHEGLEVSLDLLSPALDRERYVRVLNGFVDVYAPTEVQLRDVFDERMSEQLHLTARWKSHNLISDLDALGEKPWGGPASSAPFTIESTDQALGVLYVMEGATLGAQFMRLQLRNLLHLVPDEMRFFDGYGERTSGMWAEMRTILNHELVSEAQQSGAAASAKMMFAVMSNHFLNRHAFATTRSAPNDR